MATKKKVPQPRESTAKDRYEKLKTHRSPYLERAYECAALTIPALFPRPGTSESRTFVTPYQTIGAEGVNTLTSKLMLAVFPAGSAFFRLELDAGVIDKLRQKVGQDETAFDQAKEQFEAALARIEQQIMSKLETSGSRQPLSEMFKHCIVTGNALIEVLPNGKLKLHTLANYVVKRDSKGNELEIIVLEKLDRQTLPPQAKAIADADSAMSTDKEEEDCELYTRVWRDNGKWNVIQELCGQIVPGTEGTYPLEKSPWLAQRFTAVDGEDYGRGFVEERLGSLRSAETLEQAIVEGTAIAAKVLFSVDESGVTSKKVIAESANGAVVDGNFEKDVKILRLDKMQDFQVAMALRNDLKKDLQKAFLILAGVQREAERVTAEEVRTTVAELETTFSGYYSVVSQSLQHPLVVCWMSQMAKAGDIPHLPPGTVAPSIITGLDGLGRSSDLGKLQALLKIMTDALGPQGVAASVDPDNLATRLGAALAYDVKGLVKSSDQIKQEQAQSQQGEMAKAAVGPAIKAVSDHAMAATQAAQHAPPTTQPAQ